MTWIKAVPPKMLHDRFGVYHGQWQPEMDRCWIREEDGVCVCSRLIRVPKEWGERIEHVTITRGRSISSDGSGSFTWAEKQQIKDELFGSNRLAVEVFPKADRLIDVSDVYHLWVFDKRFELPFGIHPKEYTKAVNRGYSMDKQEVEELQKYYEKTGKESTPIFR